MRKRGDVRQSDGFIFWSLERKWYKKDEFREKWLSPESFARRQKLAAMASVKSAANRRAIDLAYAEKARENSKARMRQAWLVRPKEMMVTAKRAFCKKHQIAFDLDADDFEIPDVCPLLGIKLVRGVGKAHEGSPELDRIDPNGGYVKGNVWVISRKANMIKTNATIDEIKRLVANWPY